MKNHSYLSLLSADTGSTKGFLGNNQTEPATMCVALKPRCLFYSPCASSYAFDVNSKTQAFTNRRVFAYVDTGVADGVQLDTKGNVYAGCGDGAHVS
jgi:gluconolactonase